MPAKIKKCGEHPKYRALKYPVANCRACEHQFFTTWHASNAILDKQVKLLGKMKMSHLSPAKFTDVEKMQKLAELEMQRRALFQ